MGPGSGQRATETLLNPARGSRARGRAGPSRFLGPEGPGLPPQGLASTASGVRERGDLVLHSDRPQLRSRLTPPGLADVRSLALVSRGSGGIGQDL